MIVSKL